MICDPCKNQSHKKCDDVKRARRKKQPPLSYPSYTCQHKENAPK